MTYVIAPFVASILFCALLAANGLAIHAARKRDAIARGL